MGMSSGGGSSLSGVNSEINVTPMADIMLVLLIIFMITTPLIQQGIQINMAAASNAAEAPELDMEGVTTVTVTRESLVYVNSEPVPDEELVDQISKSRERAPDLPLFVRGDVAAPFGKIVDVVNKARDAGVERIGMVVERERSTSLAGGQ